MTTNQGGSARFDPWGPISSALYQLNDSGLVKRVIAETGMLSVAYEEPEPGRGNTNSVRIRLYEPCIASAYSALTVADRRTFVHSAARAVWPHLKEEGRTKLREILQRNGWQINEEGMIETDFGGKLRSEAETPVGAPELGIQRGNTVMTSDRKKVWVVHGRNWKVRDAMFTFLRAIGLQPIEWGEALALTSQGTPYTGDVLDRAFAEAHAAVVLITGEDVARLGTRFLQPEDTIDEKELTAQARPNVIFEAGMAFGKYPDRTIIVEFGRTRTFSDVIGRNVVRFSDTTERRQGLADRLRTVGCLVTTENRTDWHRAGDFGNVAEFPDIETANDGVGNVVPPNRRRVDGDRATDAPISKPCVSIGFHKDGVLSGFEYVNYGPGPAFHVEAGPLNRNGYTVTFDHIPELAPNDHSDRFVASVRSNGEAPSVTESDLSAMLDESFAELALCFEDASRVRHREDFEIRCDFFGGIEVRRRPTSRGVEPTEKSTVNTIAKPQPPKTAALDVKIGRFEMRPLPDREPWSYCSLVLSNEQYDSPIPAHNVSARVAFRQGRGSLLKIDRALLLTENADGLPELKREIESLPRKKPAELILAYTRDGQKFFAAEAEPERVRSNYALESAEWNCSVKVAAKGIKIIKFFVLTLWDDRPIEVREVPLYEAVPWSSTTVYRCNFCQQNIGSLDGIKAHVNSCGEYL